MFADIMGESGLISKVELSGYNPNGAMAAVQMRGKLSGLKDTTGQPIFKTDMQGSTRYALDGMDMFIKYEYFAAKSTGMALSSVQGAYITKRYIYGGHVAEYDFEVHYQIAPPGENDSKRLQAVELLNAFGEWAEESWPDIGDDRSVLKLQTTSGASYLGATDDHYEDYLIPLKLTYEVNV